MCIATCLLPCIIDSPIRVSHDITTDSELKDAVLDEPPKLPQLIVKVLQRGLAHTKNVLLQSVPIKRISSVSLLKEYLKKELEVSVIRDVGYYIRGRRKVWFTSDEDLNSYITGTLIKGKGSLWCEALPSDPDKHQIQPNDESYIDDSESELSFCEPKQKKKKNASEEKRSRIQEIFTELRKNHGPMYSGPQYRLWAEAIGCGKHSSFIEPPLGSMF